MDKREAARLSKEFDGLLRRGWEIYFPSPSRRFDVRPLLRTLNEARQSTNDFDSVFRIEFTTEQDATIFISWSNGFHSGKFAYRQEDGTWRRTEQEFHF